jgi:hypothetical protein
MSLHIITTQKYSTVTDGSEFLNAEFNSKQPTQKL